MIADAGSAPGAAWPMWLAACVAALATGLCTWLFARLAERWGWVDDGSDAPARKHQARPVAPVGGPAIACGCALALIVAAWNSRSPTGAARAWIGSSAAEWSSWTGLDTGDAWVVLALVVAFAVGLCDDLKTRGLTPLHKLVGQMLAAGCLAIAAARGSEAGWLGPALWFVGGVVAQNALNTFDNADGAAGTTALLGFAALLPSPVSAAGAPAISGALCGFLPFNLWLRRGASGSGGSVPIAYLGDSGSHALGILLLIDPVTRLALLLPLLDLVRVAIVRARLRIPPWRGDRRHLAHRMQERGWSPTRVVAGMCTIAAPAVVAGAIVARRAADGFLVVVGVLLSTLLFVAALRRCAPRA